MAVSHHLLAFLSKKSIHWQSCITLDTSSVTAFLPVGRSSWSVPVATRHPRQQPWRALSSLARNYRRNSIIGIKHITYLPTYLPEASNVSTFCNSALFRNSLGIERTWYFFGSWTWRTLGQAVRISLWTHFVPAYLVLLLGYPLLLRSDVFPRDLSMLLYSSVTPSGKPKMFLMVLSTLMAE